MDKEEQTDKHKRSYTAPKPAKKEDHVKTTSELDRRNAHLHAKPEEGKEGKKGDGGKE